MKNDNSPFAQNSIMSRAPPYFSISLSFFLKHKIFVFVHTLSPPNFSCHPSVRAAASVCAEPHPAGLDQSR